MAKKCMVKKEQHRQELTKKYKAKRAQLKAVMMDKKASMEERFSVMEKMAKLPRNSSAVRQHNRCELTGRPRAVYRKFKLCRIKLRELASAGQIPGMVKSSW